MRAAIKNKIVLFDVFGVFEELFNCTKLCGTIIYVLLYTAISCKNCTNRGPKVVGPVSWKGWTQTEKIHNAK